MTRLAEVAAGGPVALRPSPTQAVAGFGRRVGMFPAGRSAAMLNQSVERASRLRDQAGEFITVNIDRTRQLAEAAGSIWAAGRDASLQRTEQIAEQRGDRETARRINRTRRQLGAVDATELPIRRYDAAERRHGDHSGTRPHPFGGRSERAGLRDGEQGTQERRRGSP